MKQFFLIIAILLFYNCRATAQAGKSTDSCATLNDSITQRIVYTHVDKMPEYVGGADKIRNYIQKNYNPPQADDFQASFHAEFVIDENGTLIGERIRNKKMEDITQAEKELLRVLKSMPKWVAGECKGKPVPVKMNFPLYF